MISRGLSEWWCRRTGGDDGRGLAHGAVGPARVIAFGASNVAPAGAVVGGLVIVVSYAGFASPLVVLVAFGASLCCASSIVEFARRLPSAGSLYTYNSRGLGRTGGFLTGWMMVFAYALYVPAGIALTSAYAAQLGADVLHVTIAAWVLFLVILGAVALVAYLGIRTSSSADLVLVAGEVTVIAALAVTILVRVGLGHYTAAVFSPASSPHNQLTDITNAMIYGITAFAGYETAAVLGEEARKPRRCIPASIIGVVLVAGVFYLLSARSAPSSAGSSGPGGICCCRPRPSCCWRSRCGGSSTRMLTGWPTCCRSPRWPGSAPAPSPLVSCGPGGPRASRRWAGYSGQLNAPESASHRRHTRRCAAARAPMQRTGGNHPRKGDDTPGRLNQDLA